MFPWMSCIGFPHHAAGDEQRRSTDVEVMKNFVFPGEKMFLLCSCGMCPCVICRSGGLSGDISLLSGTLCSISVSLISEPPSGPLQAQTYRHVP